MTTKHTPSPWAYDDHEIYSEQTDHGAAICTMNTTSAHFTKEEAEANAQLIAAAPELLAALIHVSKIYASEIAGRGIVSNEGDTWRIIQNAIKTAVKQ